MRLLVDGLDGALWLRPCGQVHTIRMRLPIDVAHLDGGGRVLEVVTLAPRRLGPIALRGRSVVEAGAGRFAAWGVPPGVRLALGEERRGSRQDRSSAPGRLAAQPVCSTGQL